ncbi:MAG TPA: mannose-1-phosphate guanylyltransferase/mannose-6-phosphate isomerase, partial [Paenirhodobacter sp.]
DAAGFRAAVLRGTDAARAGHIVTFGVMPDRPETGYGWLELAGPAVGDGPVPLEHFIEKPDAARALELLSSGHCLWNAGIFLVTARTLIAAYRRHAPGLVPPVEAAVARAQTDLGFLRLDSASWDQAADISLDYAVMEHAAGLMVVPWRGGWSDLGNWEAVRKALGPDADGVVRQGEATAIDCRDTLLHAGAGGVELVGIGLRDIVAVATPDAVLIADRCRGEEVRRAVQALKEKGAPEATDFPRVHRPWGWYETLAGGGRFKVKRIVVNPGGILSLQSHFHRAEHWVVVSGTARATIGGQEQNVTENQSVYIPPGTRHRLENPGKMLMVLIEVQTGVYLGEDDITRFEDVYARP